MTVLIGPEYKDSTILSEYESRVVHKALSLARSDDRQEDALALALSDWVLSEAALSKYPKQENESAFGEFLHKVMERIGEHVEDMRGLIWNWEDPSEVIFLREEEGQKQIDVITALSKLLTTGGWMAEFLKFWVPRYAEKYPEPLDVMFWLSEQAINLESDVHHAKELMKHHPDLLGIEPKKAAAKGAR